MGFLDNVTSAVNRGTAAAGRGADKIKLNARIGELNRQRQNLAAQLGASLYEATRGDAALTAGREALYDGIARIDAEREECQRQIAAIDEQAAAAATAATGFACAVCGAHMTGADLFCAGCGTPAEKARAQAPAAPTPAHAAGPACASCGAPLGAGDMFCMSCGAKVAALAVSAGAGVGASELVEAAGDGNVTVTPGGESAPKGGE
ncbi:zinc ribbon domain-containing protein [Adlercreutzia muris]|nr:MULTISPECIES: zinc-ribbon domain-containing protein [Adlercreutzia]MCR2028930.1 zinc ribbon domain-containing protein [Adlercreutzia muris]MCU7585172.1 zinc ribbon domain-containing protein [Adlercreutzia muris]